MTLHRVTGHEKEFALSFEYDRKLLAHFKKGSNMYLTSQTGSKSGSRESNLDGIFII